MKQQKWTAALLAVVLVIGLAGAVRAETTKPNAFTKTVAQAVMTCVRPSSQLHKDADYLPRINSHKYSLRYAGRVDLTVTMAWNGLWTKNPYESTFTIKIQLNDERLEILGIDYTDDCLVPAPDVRPLNALIRKLNEQLSSRD